MGLIDFKRLERVLNEYAVEVRNLYQDKLIKENRIATGDLLNTAECRVEAGDNEYEVKLTLQDYWRDIETGTEPHFPPLDALIKWIEVKPVIPRPDANGRIPTKEQLAYLIGRKISIFGTEGNYPLSNSVAEINAKYRGRMRDALKEDASDYIAGLLAEQLH